MTVEKPIFQKKGFERIPLIGDYLYERRVATIMAKSIGEGIAAAMDDAAFGMRGALWLLSGQMGDPPERPTGSVESIQSEPPKKR